MSMKSRMQKDEAIRLAGAAANKAAAGLKKDEAIALAGTSASKAIHDLLDGIVTGGSTATSDAGIEDADDDASKLIAGARRVRRPSFHSKDEVVARVSWCIGESMQAVELVRRPLGLSIIGDLESAPRWALDAIMAALRSGR